MLKGEATAASRRVPIKLRNSATGVYTAGLTLTGSEIQVSVNGAAFANATGTVVEVGSGAYYYEAATADCATRGYFEIKVIKTGYETWFWVEPVEEP